MLSYNIYYIKWIIIINLWKIDSKALENVSQFPVNHLSTDGEPLLIGGIVSSAKQGWSGASHFSTPSWYHCSWSRCEELMRCSMWYPYPTLPQAHKGSPTDTPWFSESWKHPRECEGTWGVYPWPLANRCCCRLLSELASPRDLEMESHYCQERLAIPVLLSGPSSILEWITRWLTVGKSASFPEFWVTHLQIERVQAHLCRLGAWMKDKYLLSNRMCSVLIILVGHVGWTNSHTLARERNTVWWEDWI